MQSATPYRGSSPNGTAEGLPSSTTTPTDEAPPTPPSTSTTPKLARRRRSPNPTATSLLPEDEKEVPLPHEDTRVNTSPGADPGEGFDGGFDEGQRATIRGMICRKSKAFMFGQLLSLFLVSDTCYVLMILFGLMLVELLVIYGQMHMHIALIYTLNVICSSNPNGPPSSNQTPTGSDWCCAIISLPRMRSLRTNLLHVFVLSSVVHHMRNTFASGSKK